MDQIIKAAPGGKPMDGAALAAWREHMGFSQREAAEALGCSRTALGNWELGREVPRYIGLACAALALGMPSFGSEDI